MGLFHNNASLQGAAGSTTPFVLVSHCKGRAWAHSSKLASRVQGRGKFGRGNILLWEISYFKCGPNFPLNFQATVRNKPRAKFSHCGFARIAGGMLCVSHSLLCFSLPSLPSFSIMHKFSILDAVSEY